VAVRLEIMLQLGQRGKAAHDVLGLGALGSILQILQILQIDFTKLQTGRKISG
jgi:hypothetical protein